MSNNPYRVGGVVGGTDYFVGRTTILTNIKNTFSDGQPHALLLWGHRRIGKTSLLQQLKTQWSNEDCVIFIDWQEKKQWPLQKVIEDLTFIIRTELDQAKPDLGKDAKVAFPQWLKQQQKSVVFLFDEFDVIAADEGANEITTYFKQLLTLNPQRLKWLFVVGPKIEVLTQTARNELFGKMESRLVSYLDQNETQELIRLSEQNQTLQWSTATVDKIWQLTFGHPYFTQYLCSEVWNGLHKDNPSQVPVVTASSIDVALRETLTATHSILESLWSSLSPLERVVASALAQKKKWGKLTRPLDKIIPKLEEARDSLLKLELISLELISIDGDNYRFQVEMIRRWIETQTKSFYEDLEKIEPDVETIYAIAKRLQETRPQNAQALLTQAIDINSYHTQANLLLAKRWEAATQLEKARETLENLHSYNPNVAKEPLVRVLLMLAKSLEDNNDSTESSDRFEKVVLWWKSTFSPNTEKEEKRLDLYKQVLTLVPGNQEALKGKKSIEKQRGDRVWKQQVKKFFDNHSKMTVQGIGVMVILVVSFGVFFLSPSFPPGIVLEIDNSQNEQTLLKNVPSASPHYLQSITVYLDEATNFKGSPKFKYQDFAKELDLNKDSVQSGYSMEKALLQEELTKVKSFEYKDENSLLFTFKTGNLKFKDKCKASNVEGKDVSCDVRETGYLSILRGIPWWFIVMVSVFLWVIGFEFWHDAKTKKENDNVVY